MSKITKFTFVLCAAILITAPASLLAQTVETTADEANDVLITTAAEEANVPEEVIVDEMVSPEELGIKEPKLLPDSKFYFLKNWSRGIRSMFTFNKTDKAELKLKYASEKLLEARKLANKNKRPEILLKAAENFQQEMERVKTAVDKIKDTASTSPKVGKFLDKFVQQQVLHQKILDKLEEKVPEGALEKIQAVKERHLEKFGEVMQKLEDRTQIKARIENNIRNMAGSEFKAIKEMEILKRFEEKAPEEIKEKIMEARETRLDEFKTKIEQMKPEIREKFDGYMEKMKGQEEKKMEILEDIKGKIQFRPDIKEKLEQAQTRIIQNAERANGNNGLKCQTSAIAPRDCKGKVLIERDENGCPVPRCVEVTEVEPTEPPAYVPSQGSVPGSSGPTQVIPIEGRRACIALWDPVCGVNGRTYNNACNAKLANVEIKYKGACKAPELNRPTPVEVSPVIPTPPATETEPIQKKIGQ